MKLGNRQLVEELTRSATYRDYARAFSDTTAVPIALRAVQHWQPATRTVTGFAGLSEFAVPIRVGDQLVRFLQTGQVLLNQPTKFRFDQTAKRPIDWGVKVDLHKARQVGQSPTNYRRSCAGKK